MTVPRVTGVSDRWQSELSSRVGSKRGPRPPLPAAGWQDAAWPPHPFQEGH